jgi:hypothetical protein
MSEGCPRPVMATGRALRPHGVTRRRRAIFEEPGALDEVAHLARDGFLRYLVPASQPA